MNDPTLPHADAAATRPPITLTEHLLDIARAAGAWLMAEIEDDRAADAEDDFDPEIDGEEPEEDDDCATCGGSGGGGEPHLFCLACGGAGFDRRARRARREERDIDFRIDRDREARLERERTSNHDRNEA